MLNQKQNKVLNNINKIGKYNGKDKLLGTKNNDECYTSMQDILNELCYWGNLGKFKDKNIICPCDWDIVEGSNIYSITITYDPEYKTESNGVFKTVKKVEYNLWEDFENNVQIQTIDLKENEIEDFLRNKLTCNFLRALTQNSRRWGIKSITASGYNPNTNKGIKFQDVDYSKYDICITNPPFSLYSEFMSCLTDKIDFIVLAPFMNRAAPNVGLYLMRKKAYFGRNAAIGCDFINPIPENASKQKGVRCDWITSFPEAQDERNIENSKHKFGIDYELYKDEFKEIKSITMKDGTHPIIADKRTFPYNYDGWMFVSTSLLHQLDLTKYEWYGTNFKKYFNTTHPEKNPCMHKMSDTMLEGKFHAILIKKIK